MFECIFMFTEPHFVVKIELRILIMYLLKYFEYDIFCVFKYFNLTQRKLVALPFNVKYKLSIIFKLIFWSCVLLNNLKSCLLRI